MTESNNKNNNNDSSLPIQEATSVLDEIALAKRNLPQIEFQSATRHFLTAIYEKTPTRRVKLTLTFPENYPSHACIVDVASERNVPPGLKKKLDRELGAVAKEQQQMNNSSSGYTQIESVLNRLIHFVDTNRFVACWKELRQVVDKVHKLAQSETTKGSTVSIQDNKGLIQLRLQCERYYYSCRIVIHEAYPTTTTHTEWGNACRIKKDVSTNFPPKIELMLTTQARDLVRKMQDGMTATQATKLSNPVRAPKGVLLDHDGNDLQKATARVRLTQESLKGLHRDTDTLAHVRDLRAINAKTTQGNANIKAHTARERKEARRAIQRLTNNELERDREAEAKEEQWQLEERAREAGYDIHHHGEPQPSLLSLVTFLENKILRLPEATCPGCQQRSLPTDPKALSALYESNSNNKNNNKKSTSSGSSTKTDKKAAAEKKARQEARKKRPVRTYCGCWFHHECLDKLMREPPFGEACPVHTTRRLYHPDWPADQAVLEREWAAREARKREVEDAVAAFL